MALLEDKIDQIPQAELRNMIKSEVKKLKNKKNFGLVYEQHIPEVVPIFSATVKPNSIVAKISGNLGETYRVLKVVDDNVEIKRESDDSLQTVPIGDLVVIKQFGDSIFPTLVPIDSVDNGGDQSYHSLIEADNYHALQLLEYMYPKKLDCIYIDPPYNSGARDWKYNNNFVDINDTYRHSKWLSFMNKRLQLAKRLLKDDGFLIIAIDDYEHSSLGLLIEQIFPEYNKNVVTIKYNRSGTPRNGFLRVHEYLWFISKVDIEKDTRETYSTTRNLRRNGNNSTRNRRPTMFFPIYIDKDTLTIVGVGDKPADDFHPESRVFDRGDIYEIWPLDDQGTERCWSWSSITVMDRRNEVVCKETSDTIGLYIKTDNVPSKDRQTIWIDKLYDAATHGSSLVQAIVKEKFPFPKSVYAVKKAIETAIWNRENALVLDFFAGSGTTLHAVMMMNQINNTKHQCILVTNNEVSSDVVDSLESEGLRPGQLEWEKHGICRSITFPRLKYSILGHRDDGSILEGDYYTGRFIDREKPRNIKHIGFVEGRDLNLAMRKQLVSLIDGIPQSKITAQMPFFVSEQITASIIFDDTEAESFIDQLADNEHITDIYIVTSSASSFRRIKSRIIEKMSPLLIKEEAMLPLASGFEANLKFFKMDFLEPDEVAMGMQLKAILPILWMIAGAKGEIPLIEGQTDYVISQGGTFALLIKEQKFADFSTRIKDSQHITHVFIITNSEEAFFDMKAELNVPNVMMLYKNYLKNFELKRQWKD